ncbi:neutral zinc metallopeptidase [Synechococcus sp. 1G10]|uniref:neutral zinc metallopeptidase n=1 Tax=Synechococcus sp. 1G10 TaxID=2025605 RepID=UPI0018E9FA54|nr:neutral zinc metallopeptidase [Synechococcus sp. 1G10]
MRQQFGAPGDFAQAYVIAHEVGHHVHKQLGIERQLRKAQHGLATAQYNQLSVRMEVMADYLAGVWAHQMASAAAT